MGRYKRCAFTWFLVSLDLRLLINEWWIFSKVVKISDFQMLSGWIEKYKLFLSKLYSSWDNSYCVRLVIVLLDVNVGRLQFLLSKDSFFFAQYLFSDFWINFLLWDAIDLLRMSIVDSCLSKSFQIDWVLLRHVEVLYCV